MEVELFLWTLEQEFSATTMERCNALAAAGCTSDDRPAWGNWGNWNNWTNWTNWTNWANFTPVVRPLMQDSFMRRRG